MGYRQVWICEELKHTHKLNGPLRGAAYSCVKILLLARGPAGPVGTAAVWSPVRCKTLAGRFHEGLSDSAGLCDVPKKRKKKKKRKNTRKLMEHE